jgi:hypothetical protein
MKTIIIYNRSIQEELVMRMKRSKTTSNHSSAPAGSAAGQLHHAEAPLKNGWVNADTLGIAASTLCVVHCLALPLVALALPALASRLGNDHITHAVLALFVVAFCFFAIVPGYRRHKHGAVLAGMLTGVGLVLFATFGAESMFGPYSEMPLITIGNFMVVAAHLRNRKLLRLETANVCC